MLPRLQVAFEICDIDDMLSIRRYVWEPSVARLVESHLRLIGTIGVHTPYLHEARANTIEPDVLAVGTILGTIVQPFRCG